MHLYTYHVTLSEDDDDLSATRAIRIFTTSRVVAHLYDLIVDEGLLTDFCGQILAKMHEAVTATNGESPFALKYDLELCGDLPPPKVMDTVPLLFTSWVNKDDVTTLHSSCYDELYERSWPLYSRPGFTVTLNGEGSGQFRILTYSKRVYEGIERMVDAGMFPLWVSGVNYELMHGKDISEDTEILEGAGIVYITPVDTTSPALQCLHLSTDDITTFH